MALFTLWGGRPRPAWFSILNQGPRPAHCPWNIRAGSPVLDFGGCNMKWIFPGLILAVAAISVPAQPQAAPVFPTVDEIVAKHIQATGGRAAWEKVAAQTRKGVALPDSANLPLESASQAPNKWTFTIRMPNGRTLKHGFDGAQGWEDRGRPVRMERDCGAGGNPDLRCRSGC